MIQVKVIFATQYRQEPISVRLPMGATLNDALAMSRIFELYPEAKTEPLHVGVYGELVHDPARYVLEDGDRVEIYRPLLIDPKEARRRRA